MDFRNQLPPTTTSEPVLTTAPTLTLVPQVSTPPSTSPGGRSSRRWVWLTIIGIIVVGVLGGGYFAYSRGYIAIPFLTPKSDVLFNRMVDSISTISSAQYSVRVKFEGQPRDRGTKPTFDSATLNANLPISGGLGALFDPQNALKSIPGDVKVEGGMTIYVEADKALQDAHALFSIDGSYTGSDTAISVDLEVRKVEQNLYGLVRKFPSIFFVDVSGIKNKWVKMTPEDGFGDAMTSLYESQNLKQSAESLKAATKSALDGKLFTVKQHLPAETISGVRSEHYLLNIQPEKLVSVYEAVRDQRKAKGQDVAQFESIITELRKPESVKLMQAIADGSRVEIWIDRTKGLLRQIRWGLTIVPDDAVERLKDKQLYLGLTLTLENVNTKVNVDAPSPTIDYDEAARLVTGITKEKQQFDKQVANVSRVRSALSLYQRKNNVYPGTLIELQNGLKTIYTNCLQSSTNTNSANRNTNTASTMPTNPGGATPFSIETISSSIGLGAGGCFEEKEYKNGLNITDVYTGKAYEYSKDATDYTLAYQLKITSDIDSFDKDAYVDGKNTATSKDSSIEKTSTYESSQQQYEQQLKNTNSSTSTNTSTYWSSIYPCLTAAPSTTLDADKDGLSDAQEYTTYSTNPCQADSDGDTYPDKSEIENKYNPLGSGQASAAQLQQWGVSTTTSSTNTNTTTSTTVTAPKILNQTLTNSYGVATVSWTTDIPSDGIVNFGPTTTYGQYDSDTAFSTFHGLAFTTDIGKTYHYAIRSCAENAPSTTGCTTSQDYTFVAK